MTALHASPASAARESDWTLVAAEIDRLNRSDPAAALVRANTWLAAEQADGSPEGVARALRSHAHAVRFLQSCRGLLDAVTAGPIHTQAREVLELLQDSSRCQVVLVTLPEETPVNELVETAFKLEDRVGVSLGPVVVNGLYPDVPGLDPSAAVGPDTAVLADAAAFRRDRLELQRAQIARLSAELPLPQVHLPFLFTAGVGPREVDGLATHLLRQVQALAS